MNTPPLQRCQWCGQDWWDAHVCPKLSPTLTAYAPAAVKVSNTTAPPPAADAVSDAMVKAAWDAAYGHPRTQGADPDGWMRAAIAAALAARSEK